MPWFAPMEPALPEPIAVKAIPTLPWDQPDFHGYPPIDSAFGYYERRGRWLRRSLHPRGCAREELVARVGDMTSPAVTHVWTDDNPNVRSIREVSFLHDDVVKRIRKDARSGVKSGILHLIVWLSLIWMLFKFDREIGDEYWQGLAILALIFGLIPLIRGCFTLLTIGSVTRSSLRRSARTARFQEWLGRGRAPTIKNLCVAIVALGVMQVFIDDANPFRMPDSLKAAGMLKDEVRNGEYWRLITGTLLHGGFAHLAMNCFALFFLGRFVVRLTNGPTASFVLFVAALGGSVASLVFLPDVPTVGFSGAVLGLFGFLLGLGRRRPNVMPRNFRRLLMADLTVITLVGIAFYQWIDNAAHLGGLVTGWLMAMVAIPRGGSSFPVATRAIVNPLGWVAHAALLGFAAFTFWRIG